MKTLRRYDQFGYSVKLNFNRSGETVNTCIGGFLSLMLTVVLYAYFIKLFRTMITYDDTDIKFLKQPVTSQELGAVNFGQMNILIYFVLVSKSSKSFNIPVSMSMEEISNYFEIKFQNSNIKLGTNPRKSKKKVGSIKTCEKSDFEKVGAK